MLKNYLKLAFKVLIRRKFFTFVSLFGTSVTLVVLVVVAAMFENSFGPLPPETRHDRTLCVSRASMSGERGRRTAGPGYALLDKTIRDLPGAETSSIASSPSPVTTFTPAGKFTAYVKHTDAKFWSIMDFQFLEGMPYTDDDDRSGASVAVINEATRERYFSGEPAVGRTIRVGELSLRVVGVVENVPAYRSIPFADVWVPIGNDPTARSSTELVGSYIGLVLAPPGGDTEALKSEFQSRLASVANPDRDLPVLTAKLDGSAEAMARQIADDDDALQRIVLFLTVLALVFMVLPAINLMNLNVSRIMERASEIGVRKAFGASSATLVWQFVVENVVLTLVGGALALVISFGVLAALNRSGLIPYAEFHVNGRVFAVALAVTLFFGLVSGVYPAWRMSRLDPVEALRGGTR
jgi:putative ABC transport system permease protein